MRKLTLAVALILGAMIASPHASAQDLCKKLPGGCPSKPAPQKPRPPRPAPPAQPPQPSRCDRMWNAAAASAEREPLAAFVGQCVGHTRIRDARARIETIDAASAAAREQRCNTRLGALANDPSATSVALTSFAAECPTAAGSAKYKALHSTTAFRERMDSETRRWGLSYRELCSLSGTELIARSNLSSRRADMRIGATSGDSVANLLLGLDAFYAYATGTGKLETSTSYIYAAAKDGNPRALVEHVGFMLDQPEPNYAALDPWLMQSRAQGCASASEAMAHRVYASAARPAAKPLWDAALTGPVLFREALAGGVGRAACSLVLYSYDRKLLRWQMDRPAREALYRDAGLAGSKCGELALIQEGTTAYSGSSPFGPCATNKYDCIRSRLRALRDQGVRGAGSALLNYLTAKSLGGTGVVTAEALAGIEQDAKFGDVAAMVSTGLLRYKGEGGPADSRLAMSWCHRAAALGSAYGSACVGILGQGSQQYLQTSFKLDPCAPYEVAVLMLAPVQPGQRADVAARALKALSRAQKASLKSLLPNIRLAMRETAKSNEACGGYARQWPAILDEYVAPNL